MNAAKSSWVADALTRVTTRAGWLSVCLIASCVSGSPSAEPVDDKDSGTEEDMESECKRGTLQSNNVCLCEEHWTGDKCDRCADGWGGLDCDTETCDGGAECNWCNGENGECEEHQDDGALEVDTGEVNLSVYNHPGRSCADGGDAVSYRVSAVSKSSATLEQVPTTGCLAVNDEVLLIHLQGGGGAIDNVGNYESFRIKSLSGAVVEFETEKKYYYGSTRDSDSGLGVGSTQDVMLMRVPNYTEVSVASGATLTANSWDGQRGGVLAMSVMGKVTVEGTITMSGRGYKGSTTEYRESTSGTQGEGPSGPGTSAATSNFGGGGAGQGDDAALALCGNRYGSPGGGGGHGTPGFTGERSCSGLGGGVHGRKTSASLELGAAGGSGGNDDYIIDNPPAGAGGNGGGVIFIDASELTVTGSIQANGAAGVGDTRTCFEICGDAWCMTPTECWDFSGPGGGGAGGTVLLRAGTLDVGSSLVTATGGAGGRGDPTGNQASLGSGSAGAGGAGRIYTTGSVDGETDPPRD